LQTMTQERQRLVATLNYEQRDATQTRLRQMDRDQQQMQEMSDALGVVLGEDMSQERVRDQFKKMDKVSKNLQQQQEELGVELGLQ